MLIAFAAVFVASAAWACPSCNQALDGDPAALAFYWGTLFMMAMPYTIALTIGGGVFFVYWRAARNAPRVTRSRQFSQYVLPPLTSARPVTT